MPRDKMPDTSDLRTIASSARTANGTDTAVSSGLPGIRGAIAVVSVTAVSGVGPSMVCRLEDSLDGITWATLATSAAITAAGTYALRYLGLHGPYVRLAWDVTGTTPSFTFTHRILSV